MRHYNIPIFIPELACPHRCVFCNQNRISGAQNVPKPDEVAAIVEQYLSTIKSGSRVDIAFFGGSFTGIPVEEQEAYLKEAYKYVQEGKVQGVRVSTRPDYISHEILQLMRQYGVTTIELGAQSFDDEVLKKSGRGHTSQDIVNASELIKSYDIQLGLQMMLGLPGDNFEKAQDTAKRIIECKADNTRIYPALVIKDTPMAKMYQQGDYHPLSLNEAVSWSAAIYPLFEKAGITVLRTGLHPSDEIAPGASLLAGPFHHSFKELVLSEIWRKKFAVELPAEKGKLRISVAEEQINFAVGHKKSNWEYLKERFGWIQIKPSKSLSGYEFEARYC